MKNIFFNIPSSNICRIIFSVLVLSIFSGSMDKAGGAEACIKVTMDSISYLGNDVYEMKTLLTNISNKTLSVSEYRQHFIIQNDGIGKWTTLEHGQAAANDDGGIILKPGHKKSYTTRIAVSPSIQNLYKNNDGEVNIRFESLVTFTTPPERRELTNEEESPYWLKLQSSNWILREGM